jgi:hypothetical protein
MIARPQNVIGMSLSVERPYIANLEISVPEDHGLML